MDPGVQLQHALLVASHTRLPLSRFSRSELRRQVLEAGIVADISGVTIWRWLHEDALRPWSRRSWIFPRDPDFATKAGHVLDLYHRRRDGRALAANEFVISVLSDSVRGLFDTVRRPEAVVAGGATRSRSPDSMPPNRW